MLKCQVVLSLTLGAFCSLRMVIDSTHQVSGDTNQPGGIFSDKHVARLFCWHGSPGAFLCCHLLQHLLWCRSLPHKLPPWLPFTLDGADVMLGPRRSGFIGDQ